MHLVTEAFDVFNYKNRRLEFGQKFEVLAIKEMFFVGFKFLVTLTT